MTANFIKYFKFILRRERLISGVWLAGLAAFSALLAGLYPGLFPTREAMQGLAATMNTPAMTALMGPVYGLEAPTPALMMAQECLIWMVLAVIVMNIFFINRHTRADEELGRLEMLASLPVGRLANSLAAMAFSLLLNLAAAAVIAIFTIVIPLEGATVAGAAVYGLSIGVQGLVFAAVTLLAAQLFSTARGSMGVSFAVLGLAYVLRAQGDVAGNALSYISPLGLGLKIEAFYRNDFMPVAVLLTEAVIITLAALLVHTRRDIGAGIFPARKGRAQASAFLRSGFGWAWRMSRSSFYAWAIGIFILGATYGAVVGELDTFVKDNEMMTQVMMASGGLTMVDAFVAMLGAVMSLIITVPLINCVNRLYGEEKRGRIDPIMAAAVSRGSLYGSFILIAGAEAAVLALLNALGIYATGQSTGLLSLSQLLSSSYAYLPAMLFMVGLAALLVGCLPKYTMLGWLFFAFELLMFYFGRIFTDIPAWVLKISPFANIPQIPVQEFTAAPLIILALLALVLAALGLIGYKHRDLSK